MKKILIIVILSAFCGCLSLQASPVSSEKALDIAKKVLAAQKLTKSGSEEVKIVWDGEYATKADIQPAFYVVAREGGGWVMVAGDDNVPPVLGLSYDGRFETENMPDNVRWWMNWTKSYVRSISTPTKEVSVLWAKFIDTKSPDFEDGDYRLNVLMDRRTPEWDQGNNDANWFFGEDAPVFNRFCPMDGASHAVTGCVATALAEVLTYQSGQPGVTLPSKGTGTVGGYSVANGVAPYSYDLALVDYQYLWSGLRGLATISDIQTAIADAKTNGDYSLIYSLGHLLADLGAVVQADYSAGGTSASTGMIPYYLNKHFGFNGQAYYESFTTEYTQEQWETKLKNEINKRPLIYTGEDSINGYAHAFVLDGYGTYNGFTFFHVNYGWGGSNNGYFYLGNFADGQGHNYNTGHGGVFDFYPAPETDYPVLSAYYGNTSYPGIKVVKITPSSFRIYYCVINNTSATYNGTLKLKVQKKDGTEYGNEFLIDNFNIESTPSSHGIINGYLGSWAISDISFGDRVVCYYKVGDEWRLLSGVPGSVVYEWPLMPVPFIDTKSSYSVGEIFTFRLKNYDQLYKMTEWTITDPDGLVSTYPQSDRNFVLAKSGTYKIQAAVSETAGTVSETLETYITVTE